MNKALRPCRQPGCPNLVIKGYCEEHKPLITEESKKEAVKALRNLDRKKDPKEIKFYNSPAWKKTSKLYRIKFPLCERCVSRGYYDQESEMVHHVKSVREIWQDNGNPLSWRYLQALCNNCHLEDLRAMRGKANNKKQYKY